VTNSGEAEGQKRAKGGACLSRRYQSGNPSSGNADGACPDTIGGVRNESHPCVKKVRHGDGTKETPTMKFEYLLAPTTEDNPRNGEGSVIILNDGRLLLCYTEFRGGGDNDWAYIVGLYSDDGGQSWHDKHVIQPNIGGMNVMSASLLRLQSGKIAFVYLLKNSTRNCLPVMRLSEDEGESWTASAIVGDHPGYHVVNNDRPIQLSTGRILVPASISQDIRDRSLPQTVFCYYSDDEGRTWRAGEAQGMDAPCQEPGLIELKDGSVLMIIRTTLGYIYQALSTHGGESWTNIERTGLVSPCAPATIKRFPSTNDLLILYNNNQEPDAAKRERRTPLTAALSKDEGKTWQLIKDVELDHTCTYCYVSACFPGEDVLLTYYLGTERNLEALKIKRFPVEWLYT